MLYRTISISSFKVCIAITFILGYSLSFTYAQQQSSSEYFKKIDDLINQDLNKALDYSIVLEKDYPGFKEELMLKQAQIFSGLGKFSQADSLLSLVSSSSIKNTSPEYRANLFILKAVALRYIENYSDAVLQVNKAEIIYAELDPQSVPYDVNMQYAQIYSLLGNYSKALDYIDISLKKGKDLNSEQEFALLFQKVLLYDQLNNLKEEYNSLERLNNLCKGDSLSIYLGKLKLAWADYYLSVHNYELALKFLNESENVFQEKNYRRYLYSVYIKKARVFAIKHNEFAQKLFLQQAIIQAENLGDISLIFEAKLKLADLFYLQNENDSAFRYVNSVIDNSPFLKQKIMAYDILKSICLRKNNYIDGLSALENRQILSDSLNTFELNKALASGQFDFDNSKYEEDKVEIENQLAVYKLASKNHILLIQFIGAALLLAMIFGFSLYFFIKSQNERKNSLLSQKLIYLQLNAHFIFNSLTAIQGLILKSKIVNAEHYLQIFADLMQNIIKLSTHPLIPLHEELSFLMAYMQLQKLRFGNDLNYEISISDEIDPQQISIPPFLIYPYLEYAIEFRIQKKGAKGSISIQFMIEENKLLIELEDNGIGFLVPQQAFLKRPNQDEILLFELTSNRLRELNSWRSKNYQMNLINSIDEKGEEKGILQFKIKI
ncbi:MAG: histidine kinase [Bacteroidales bacterium]|nr:histidine kinase [Bacteroidales bacterium]